MKLHSKITVMLLALLLLKNYNILAQPYYTTKKLPFYNKRVYIDDNKLVPRERFVDFIHLKLNIRFQPENKKVIATVEHTFKPLRKELDSLFLDAPGINIKSVQLNGENINFNTNKDGVYFFFQPKLSWDKNYTLKINYEASPEKGIYFIGWNNKNNKGFPEFNSRKQIWTQGQGIDNRYWIPMFDSRNDKVISETIITFDSKFKVLSNGKLISKKDNKDGTTTWHYQIGHPHAPYLIMIGIGNYEIKKSKSKSGVNMYFWYYPEFPDRVNETYKYSEEMIDFYEQEIGVKFPWSQYSQIPVQDFMYSAMENTTATVFGDFSFVDKRAAIDRDYLITNAHELAHQWFGDYVTAKSDAHHWLQESFATFYSWLFVKYKKGVDYYDYLRRNAALSSIDADNKDLYPVAHSEGGSVRFYPKGAYVLHMLRYVLGEEQYRKGIKHYLLSHPYENVDSEDLLSAFNETLGYPLDWFWEEWIYHAGEPDFKVKFYDVEDEKTPLGIFDVEQNFTANEFIKLFKMPIEFAIYFDDGTYLKKKVWIEEQHHLVKFLLPYDKKISYVLFDPGSQVLKKVKFNKPLSMLKNQLLYAENMLDRLDAVNELSKFSIEKTREILQKAFKKEKFFAVKNEILEILINDYDSTSNRIIIDALQDKNSKVRYTILKNTIDIDKEYLKYYEKLLKDSSYNIIELALEKLSFLYPENTEKYLNITKNETGTIGKNVKIKWLEIAYNFYKDKKYVDSLVQFTSNSYEFRTRYNAMNALKRINYFDENLLINLIDAIKNPNRRLSSPAMTTLKYFFKQNSYKHSIYNYIKKNIVNQKDRKKFSFFFVI